METVQQNGRFTLFSSKFLSIYSILYGLHCPYRFLEMISYHIKVTLNGNTHISFFNFFLCVGGRGGGSFNDENNLKESKFSNDIDFMKTFLSRSQISLRYILEMFGVKQGCNARKVISEVYTSYANVNTRRMSKPDIESIIHIKNQ